MDHLDNPSTRNRVVANAGDPAETSAPPDPDAAAASASAEVPAAAAAPAPANPIPSQDDLENDPIDDARLEKIETIKKALADGTYNVSAEELARKLIEHMLEP
jgi:anti-sigma28 factor (negative regulator of flagellin synthesis)